jgi:hypothetical protein
MEHLQVVVPVKIKKGNTAIKKIFDDYFLFVYGFLILCMIKSEKL